MHRNFRTVCGCLKRANSAVAGLLASKPWLQWVFAFAALQLFFLVDRCVGLDALIEMYGTEDDQDSARVKVAVIAIGVAEDFVCAIYFVFFLWLADMGLSRIPARLTWLAKTLRFLWYFLLFLIFATPFVADILITRLRQMRFTFDLVTMALNEKGAASAVPISPEQLHEAYVTVGVTLAIALLFGVVGALWMNMTDWDPFARCVKWVERSKTTDDSDTEHNDLSDSTEADTDGEAAKKLEQGGADDANTAYMDAKTPFPESPTNFLTVFDHSNQTQTSKKHVTSRRERVKVWLKQVNWRRVAVYFTCAAIFLVLIPLVMLKIAQHGASPLYADAAANATLNELFGYFFHASFMPDLADGTIASAVAYLSVDTEQFKLVNDRSLVRTTTGFRGDLAFNVSVDPEDPPNVVVLVVESFRYHDSQYLVGNNTYLLKDQNITITPQFDRWAKRGIAFHNFWSSWRTSRSVESILFGQVPYDSVSDSGTTGGREDVKLSGMPQLFTSKGYSTMFTTGCILGYDGWDEFFGAHGFDTVLGSDDFKRLGEEELGIDPKDWALVSNGGKARAMRNWGVHDDVALEVLGNLLLNETAAQRERVESGQAKRPVFVNHYTISSHTPFYDRPQWYSDAKKPDFSALYKGEEYASEIRNYLEMRYFTDMAIGKFLDRMESEGVLNDTIVVISGDHGQAPEFGLDVPEKREMSVQRVAATLIAEGRLGEYAGMIMDDVAEQYDLLNTLADIVGVPDGGFVQDGVGRSLKRRLPEGKERLVYSNNPSRKLSIVRDHQRLRYDANSNAMELYNAETDHDMEHDLFPALDAAAKKQWRAWRDDGRRLNGYYKKRWDHECLLDATC